MPSQQTIAYIMSRFPKISETFILYEIVELERLGYRVEVFPLLREREAVVHPEARPVIERAHYSTPYDRTVLAAHRYWLRRAPQRYLELWRSVLAGNATSLKFLSRSVVVLLQAAWFAQQMEELGITHVHAHFATHPALAAYIVNQLTGIPYSFTAHADDIYLEPSMLAEKIDHAHTVVTISDYNRRWLQQRYGYLACSKVVVVHCGVDSAIFEPQPLRPARDEFVVSCVARLEEKKGHRYLIDACATLRDRGIAFRCQLIGDGELRPEIEAQIERLGLAGKVVLLGRQPRSRVKELLAESDVMVLASVTTPAGRQEGIPVALMEALATELPVIATTISGIPELIDHGRSGLLVPERNARALSNALLLLATNPAIGRQFGRAGRAKVRAAFDLRQNTQLLSTYFNAEHQAARLAAAAVERAV